MQRFYQCLEETCEDSASLPQRVEVTRAFYDVSLELRLRSGRGHGVTGLYEECRERTAVSNDDAVGHNVPTRCQYVVLDSPGKNQSLGT